MFPFSCILRQDVALDGHVTGSCISSNGSATLHVQGRPGKLCSSRLGGLAKVSGAKIEKTMKRRSGSPRDCNWKGNGELFLDYDLLNMFVHFVCSIS